MGKITLANWYGESFIKKERVMFDPFSPYLNCYGHIDQFENNDANVIFNKDEPGILVVEDGKNANIVRNACSHRQAIIASDTCKRKSLRCPAHAWNYDLSGTLLHTPLYQGDCGKSLKKTPLDKIKGLMYSGNTESVVDFYRNFYLAEDLFNFEDLNLYSSQTETYDFNWKTFLDVYLELYHVKPVHPGLGNFVDGINYKWYFGKGWSAQVMPLSTKKCPVSSHWKNYQDIVFADKELVEQNIAAIWVLLYPGVMLEWYPHAKVISTLKPAPNGKCLNKVEVYSSSNTSTLELLTSAYNESANEDASACLGIEQGRKIMWDAEEYVDYSKTVYVDKHEDGIPHFYNWLANR